mmetsp:Transcript_69215/g.200502  ORF Transcript_69215/g.200502 Transcript_69215/m.200502 type:complete len:206 (+) Transcript_69215:395-1012(+)
MSSRIVSMPPRTTTPSSPWPELGVRPIGNIMASLRSRWNSLTILFVRNSTASWYCMTISRAATVYSCKTEAHIGDMPNRGPHEPSPRSVSAHSLLGRLKPSTTYWRQTSCASTMKAPADIRTKAATMPNTMANHMALVPSSQWSVRCADESSAVNNHCIRPGADSVKSTQSSHAISAAWRASLLGGSTPRYRNGPYWTSSTTTAA